MTFEERLDRIAEKHEALAQTVEILAGMQKDNEKKFSELGDYIRRVDEQLAATDAKIDRLADFINDHEERLNDLEEE